MVVFVWQGKTEMQMKQVAGQSECWTGKKKFCNLRRAVMNQRLVAESGRRRRLQKTKVEERGTRHDKKQKLAGKAGRVFGEMFLIQRPMGMAGPIGWNGWLLWNI